MDPIEPWVDRDELRRLADALLAAPAQPQPEPPHDATYGDEFEGFTSGPPIPAPEPGLSPGEQAAKRAAADMAEAARSHHEPAPQPAAASPAPGVHRQATHALANARQIAQRGGLLDSTASPTEATRAMAAELTHVSPVPGSEPPAAIAAPAAPATAEPASESQAARAATPPQPITSSETPFLERLQSFAAWLRHAATARALFVIDRDGGILLDEVQSSKLHQVARTLAQASRSANRQAGADAIGNLHVKVSEENILEVVPVQTRYGHLILGAILPQPLGAQNAGSVARALQHVVDGRPAPQAP